MTREELAAWHTAEADKAAAVAEDRREGAKIYKPENRARELAAAGKMDAIARFHREAAALVLTESTIKAA